MFELATHGLARSDIARVHDIIAPCISQTPLLHASGEQSGRRRRRALVQARPWT